jgi:hypothetical protein
MSSTIGKKNIAHKGSGHGVVGPLAMSLLTPPAPPTPTPTPFVYSARSSNAKKSKKKYLVAGKPIRSGVTAAPSCAERSPPKEAAATPPPGVTSDVRPQSRLGTAAGPRGSGAGCSKRGEGALADDGRGSSATSPSLRRSSPSSSPGVCRHVRHRSPQRGTRGRLRSPRRPLASCPRTPRARAFARA